MKMCIDRRGEHLIPLMWEPASPTHSGLKKYILPAGWAVLKAVVGGRFGNVGQSRIDIIRGAKALQGSFSEKIWNGMKMEVGGVGRVGRGVCWSLLQAKHSELLFFFLLLALFRTNGPSLHVSQQS